MGIINFAQPEASSFIVDIIIWLVKISSSIVVGVVLFTVLLKLVTLPLDYFSKASMRKNSLLMEEMRPELEKLQKQYANDKDLYNQKMMALYKKNGYSMFGACLPTILTLVIFIVALNGFTNYSRYQNRLYFYNMSNAYNEVIYDGIKIEGNEDYISEGENGTVVIDYQKLYNDYAGASGEKTIGGITYSVTEQEITVKVGDKFKDIIEGNVSVQTNGGYVKTTKYFLYNDYNKTTGEKGNITWSVEEFETNKEMVVASGFTIERDGQTYNYEQAEQAGIKFNVYEETVNEKNEKVGEYVEKTITPELFILDACQQKSADKYREEQASFLWIKNLWVADSATESPLVTDWETFRSTHEYPDNAPSIGENGYAQLTMKLETEKNQSNGYFILVALTAGISFLTQYIMRKTQQAQMELQTVDGQGAQTQKMMQIIMPIMMAFFAFRYTSAFSIYIILSSIFNILTTIGINKIVDRKIRKEKEKNGGDQKVRGRVYVPKEEPKKEQPKKKDDSQATGDFLTGEADGKKRIRGRLK